MSQSGMNVALATVEVAGAREGEQKARMSPGLYRTLRAGGNDCERGRTRRERALAGSVVGEVGASAVGEAATWVGATCGSGDGSSAGGLRMRGSGPAATGATRGGDVQLAASELSLLLEEPLEDESEPSDDGE
jgi:hypothetical protein